MSRCSPRSTEQKAESPSLEGRSHDAERPSMRWGREQGVSATMLLPSSTFIRNALPLACSKYPRDAHIAHRSPQDSTRGRQ